MKPALITLILGTILFACNESEQDLMKKDEVVDFDFKIEGDCSTDVLEVVFENKSSDADSYLWDFGDGTSSNLVNPKKVYPKCGDYTVRLNAVFSGNPKQIERVVAIERNSDGTNPAGQMSFTRTNTTNFEIVFTISTDEPSYFLAFGDGQTIISNEKEVKHQYAAPGNYLATLVLKNNDGCNCASISIDLQP